MRFVTTRWSMILAAQGPQGSEQAREALEDLCRTYWYPLYAYARRRGQDAEDAQDAVQGFFSEMLDKERFAVADRERGRFRAFLITAFGNHLSHEREKARALKRGGGRRILSLDPGEPELRYAREPAHEETPERLFERDWAVAVLGTALRGLQQAYAERDQADLFLAAKPYLVGEAEASMTEAAERLDMRVGAFRVAVHRLRRRYQTAVRAEITHTLPDGAFEGGECEVELRALAAALNAG
jgi:RNA polymerase sigma factor (sigma-70 family)